MMNGRYAVNNVQSSFSQVPYSVSLNHLGITSRGGSELYPSLGNMGSSVTDSMGNFASGSTTGRSLSSVRGLREPGIVSRLNLVGNGVSGDTRPQGLMDGVLSQGLLQKQIAAVFQQNQEFSIRNEDFPALPRYKGGTSDHLVDMLPKDHIHDYDISQIQNQPLPIGRTTGFGLMHPYPSGHQQHHPSAISSGGLSMFHTSNQDVHARGSDLLPSSHLNYYQQEELHKRFASPWRRDPVKEDPQFKIPECYNAKGVSSLDILPFAKFPLGALFYTFYSMQKDEAQLHAANELINRGWCYHKELRVWLTREPNVQPLVKTTSYERGSYWCFDPNRWSPFLKENFVLQYNLIEERPTTVLRKEQGHQQPQCERAGSPFYADI